MKASTSQPMYASGHLEVDLARRELRVLGVAVPIGGRAFEIIEVLVRSAGELVTKDDLMHRVWPGAIVEEQTLRVHISAVRKALGPDRGLLKTVSGRGYRLLGTWNTSRAAAPVGDVDTGGVAAAAPSVGSVSNNLPAAQTNLIGRARAVQELQDLLSAYRVITLVGAGGIGKTKLALELARHMFAQGYGDVWLVELASLSHPGLLAAAVASALGLRFEFVDVSAEIVARAVGQRKILLLLDNCEHIIDAAARFVETMIRLCPHATVLATSREVLRIDGEYAYRVPPLEVPDREDGPGNVLDCSAAQLFVARVTALHSAFAPDDRNLRDVAKICQRLDGIPLAIEFAAARAAMLGVSEVASHLDNRFSLLSAGRRTTLARHQTLRAALDWSYDLLTPSEQHLLRHLSMFPAGFTVEAATAIMRDTGHTTTVIDGVENLVAKSLVTLDESSPGGRWRLLETIRAYAFEKLRANGEAQRASRWHAEFFRDLLTPASGVSCLEATPDAPVRYGREIDNIRAALDWCFSPAGDASIGRAITAFSIPVWFHLDLVAECRRRIEIALVKLDNEQSDDVRLRMPLCIGRGMTLNHTGARTDEAVSLLTEGLRIAEALGDNISQMYALWGLWLAYSYKGNYRATEPLAERFWRLATESADPARIFRAERLVGSTMSYRGNQAKAREHLERAVEQYHRSLERPQAAWLGYNLSDFVKSSLARVLCLQGLLDQARNLAQTSIDRMQLASQKLSLCYSLVEAACPIAIMISDMDAAARHVTLLVDTAAALDLTYWKSLARCWERLLLVKQGNYDAGVTALRAALEVCDDAGGASFYPGYLGALADGLSGMGKLNEAGITLDDALAKAECNGEEWYISVLLCKKGELALREPGPSSMLTAEDCFGRALTMARQQGALLWELRSAFHLARLRLEQKRPSDARQILAPVYGRFVEGFETPDLRSAKTLLDSLPADLGRS